MRPKLESQPVREFDPSHPDFNGNRKITVDEKGRFSWKDNLLAHGTKIGAPTAFVAMLFEFEGIPIIAYAPVSVMKPNKRVNGVTTSHHLLTDGANRLSIPSTARDFLGVNSIPREARGPASKRSMRLIGFDDYFCGVNEAYGDALTRVLEQFQVQSPIQGLLKSNQREVQSGIPEVHIDLTRVPETADAIREIVTAALTQAGCVQLDTREGLRVVMFLPPATGMKSEK